MDYEALIKSVDRTLATKNLTPQEYDWLTQVRERFFFKWEAIQKRKALNAMRRKLEQGTSQTYLGERMTGAPRNIPGAEGSGVVIQPEVQAGGYMRDFVPNPSYRDRMIIRPKFLGRRKRRDI